MTGKPPVQAAPPPAEGVALIHGLGNARIGMQALALRLELEGFETASVGYPSRRLFLSEAIERVAVGIAELAGGWDRVHLVGHSLGGVIASAIAAGRPDLPVGRVVMIGAPMRGSALAAWTRRLAPLRTFLGPVLDDLASRPGPVPPDSRIGAIAGVAGIPSLGREFGLIGPHDGKVTLRSAWTGAGHRAAVPVGHAMLPYSREVARLTAHFLREGRFPDDTERVA